MCRVLGGGGGGSRVLGFRVSRFHGLWVGEHLLSLLVVSREWWNEGCYRVEDLGIRVQG